MKWRLALCCFLCAAALSALGQPEYRVTVLHSFRVPFSRSYGWGIGGGQQVGDSNNLRSGGSSHALLWSGTPESLIDLHPSGWDASFATGVAGGWQSGYLERLSPEYFQRAVMWNGSRESMVMLHPQGWVSSATLGISLTDQVGDGRPPDKGPLVRHALRWQGTPESMVDLHPNGYFYSWAVDTDGEVQVGTAVNIHGPHPALWRGTADSFVSLTPPGFAGGEVYGVANGQQAGWVNNAGNGNAAIWNGSVQSFVNLNPPGMGSTAFDTNGFHQVGYTARSGGSFVRAARWSGSAKSYFDLHQFLPSQFQGTGQFSQAYGIDAEGNIIGYAEDLSDQNRGKAVMWSPVPEPGTVVGLATLLTLLATRRRAKTR
ncbi:MAG: PEP-CTERM sorting domain-containing protein [Armatimonadota bacterium]